MKRLILINLILLSTIFTMNAQWEGTNPVWTNSNVGIGRNADSNSRLVIQGPSTPYPDHKVLYIQTEGESPTYRDQVMIYSNLTSGYGIAFAGQGHHRAGIFAENIGGTTSGIGQLTLWARNSGSIILDAGKVGIGVNTPVKKLHIGVGNNSALLLQGGTAIGNTCELLFKASSTNFGENYIKAGIFFERIAGNARGNLHFAINNEANLNNVSKNDSKMTIISSGNIGIGTNNPGYKLDVIGTIRAREVKVDLNGADFVFEDDYQLRPLEEIEQFVKENKHLPEIKPATEMEANGTELGELNSKLLQKIEELTLYMIEQNNTTKKLIEEVQGLKFENEIFKEEIESIKTQ